MSSSSLPSLKNHLPQDGIVNYIEDFYDEKKSQFFYQKLLKGIAWKHEELKMFGKKIVTKRKVALYGDTGIVYTYSKKEKIALPWTEELRAIKTDLESKFNIKFNTCLLNLYYDGNEGMGWHTDDEKELEKNGIIASLSFGATRKFSFKHKVTKEKIDISLQSGSLLLMRGKTQKHWLHQLPKSKKVDQPRINLTFRNIIG
ncbi:MAG: alpha-ketoglutarate-dependent dioxygenase AlkB [Psychroflexus sp.]|nr:alpha-ketoglutarate-dependent dioxygenase AlkB [Psychroflexus sp.]MDN6309660.1 alpha-ketoglutarate-dependent dioxygenase AlkB [Psychroflexus sp.]